MAKQLGLEEQRGWWLAKAQQFDQCARDADESGDGMLLERFPDAEKCMRAAAVKYREAAAAVRAYVKNNLNGD